MIGIFDSGVGGLCSYNEVRRLLPKEDILYFADRKNAPYGTKTKEELQRLVKSNVEKLIELGADEILVACCTASTVCPALFDDEEGRIVTMIKPTAEYISYRENGKTAKITVIATEHTARAKTFSEEILKRLPRASVTEMAAQELVRLVEDGSRDGKLCGYAEEYLDRLAENIRGVDPKYLVLGCTHFSHVEKELKKRLPGVIPVNPAKLGALELVNRIKSKRITAGSGRSLYTE